MVRPDHITKAIVGGGAKQSEAPGTLSGVMGNRRIERGWIYVDGARQDDGTIKPGAGGEMRFSPFEAISERREAEITWRDILTASLQRLAFWRR